MYDHLVQTTMCPLPGRSSSPGGPDGVPGGGSNDRLGRKALERCSSADVGPAGAVGRAALDGIEHPLHVQAVGERRPGLLAGLDGPDEVDDLVAEAVLVAE